MIYAIPIILGFISLWHGGTGPQASKVVKNLAWVVTLGLCTFFAVSPNTNFFVSILMSTTSGLLCLAGKATGHGRGLGLHEPLTGMPEVLETATRLAIPYLPTYWYKVLVLSVSGFLAVGGAVLALLCVSPWAGLAVALSGLLKGLGYMVGQWLEDRGALIRIYRMFRIRIYSNQIGEFLAGFFSGLGLLLANILI